MKNPFVCTRSTWVRYSAYQWKRGADGILYLIPEPNATPHIYDPLQEPQAIVLDALAIGRMCMSKQVSDEEIQRELLSFAGRYGLLGLMTALPTTPDFMTYEFVYLPKNHFIKQETMRTEDYLKLFFPFDQLDVVKRGVESMWNIQKDVMMMALALTMSDRPTAVNMSFQRDYGERYDWLRQQFQDWAFHVTTSFFYYQDDDQLHEDARRIMQQSIAAFGCIAPSYHIALLDKPTLVWDFHSLLLAVQMIFTLLLTDDEKPLRLCKHCTKGFIASRPSTVFCSPKCKNQYTAYKNRAKKNQSDRENSGENNHD